jgi:hypothetical protein
VTPLQRLTTYALAYEKAADEYKQVALNAACAEADHKSERAKAILRYKARGERVSQAEAEAHAEADDTVGDLYLARLTSAAIADSSRQKLLQLRSMIDTARTVVASDRMTDFNHSSGFTGAA